MGTGVRETPALEDSYRRCVEVAREKAKHFHYGFKLLSDPKRYQGICALYAFARLADDFSDDDEDSERALANSRRWREAFDRAMGGEPDADPILPAVVDTVTRYRIPVQYFHELIAGTAMDATIKRYASWEDTYRYCYRVASVIGMMTIHVFGFREPEGSEQPGTADACSLAERTGIAFQLTNILRDISEDAGRGRIYLPREDLDRFGVSERQVLAGEDTPAFRALVRFEVDRAKGYYESAPRLVPLIERGSRRALEVLVTIYRRLLEEIERRDYDVLSERVTLSASEKARLAGGAAIKTLLKI
jgi:phytoene synthase